MSRPPFLSTDPWYVRQISADSSHIPRAFIESAYTVDGETQQYCFAICDQGKVYRSPIGDLTTWTLHSEFTPPFGSYPACGGAVTISDDLWVAAWSGVNPSHTDATDGGIYQSTDRGLTWTLVYKTPVWELYAYGAPTIRRNLIDNGSGAKTIVATFYRNHGGLEAGTTAVSTNGGSSWTDFSAAASPTGWNKMTWMKQIAADSAIGVDYYGALIRVDGISSGGTGATVYADQISDDPDWKLGYSLSSTYWTPASVASDGNGNAAVLLVRALASPDDGTLSPAGGPISYVANVQAGTSAGTASFRCSTGGGGEKFVEYKPPGESNWSTPLDLLTVSSPTTVTSDGGKTALITFNLDNWPGSTTTYTRTYTVATRYPMKIATSSDAGLTWQVQASADYPDGFWAEFGQWFAGYTGNISQCFMDAGGTYCGVHKAGTHWFFSTDAGASVWSYLARGDYMDAWSWSYPPEWSDVELFRLSNGRLVTRDGIYGGICWHESLGVVDAP